MEWERIEGETVFAGRVFDVVRDRVRVRTDAGERESVYDVVRHPGAVSIVALFEDGTVALVDQLRYAVGRRIRELPAGTLSAGESYEACARRELEEETGWRADRWTELATFFTTPGFCDEEMRLYLAEEMSAGEPALDEDEHLAVERVPLEEALAGVGSGAIRDAKTIVGLFAARERLRAEGRWPGEAGG